MIQTPNGKSQSSLASQASPSAVGEGQPCAWITPEAAEMLGFNVGAPKHALKWVDATLHFQNDTGNLKPIYLSSQAPKPASAVGELLVELLRRAYRFMQSDNEFTEGDWTAYENTKDEIRAVLSGQSPLRDALQTMIASAEVYTEGDEVTGYRIKTGALHRVIGMLGLTVPSNLPLATLHANYGGFTQKSLDDARDYPLIAAEADTAKEDAADVAIYSADDYVAPPPSEWSPAGQRRLIEALEQHKSAPADRLAPVEARGVVTDAEVESACSAIVCEGENVEFYLAEGADCGEDAATWVMVREIVRTIIAAFLRARESAPAQEVSTVKLLASAVTAISHLRYAVLRRANERDALELSGSVSEQLLAEIKRLGR